MHAVTGSAILDKLKTRIENFVLFMSDEGLILRGRARTFHAKQVAQHMVMEMFDIPIVANEIEVGDGRAN